MSCPNLPDTVPAETQATHSHDPPQMEAVRPERVAARFTGRPYSQAIRVGQFVFTSGQIGVDPDTNMLQKNVRGQAEQILTNTTDLLRAAGETLNDVLKMTVYLLDIADLSLLDDVWRAYVGSHSPARSIVAVSKLPFDAHIEIDFVAITEQDSRHTSN